ncbi:MAG: GYD domain-containing protein [Endomicrobiales bacterium]|nr:GYD domain-containing protein [Endomicrobiales bacterium]
MSSFFMFGKYTADALKGISGERTKKAVEIVEKLGGKITSMSVLLGQYDLVLITDFPGVESAMRASIALNKLTGIAFTTAPAVSVEQFDSMMAKNQ